MPKRDVQASNAAANRRCERTFDGDDVLGDGFDGIVGQPLAELVESLLAGEDLVPDDAATPAIGFFHSGVEHTTGRSPDVTACSVAFDERNDRTIGHFQLDSFDGNLLTIRRNFYTIERRHRLSSLLDFARDFGRFARRRTLAIARDGCQDVGRAR